MAEKAKNYLAARPVIIGGETYFTGQSLSLDSVTAAPLVAAGQIYEPDAEGEKAAEAPKDVASAPAPTAPIPSAQTPAKLAEAPKG